MEEKEGQMPKENRQYDKFDRVMQSLMKVPRSEIKAKLDAEKKAKKRKKAKDSSASGHA